MHSHSFASGADKIITFKRGELEFEALEYTVPSPEAQAVILLHGFPEAAEDWDSVARRLAQAGYRVVVPRMRGRSATCRPKRWSDYRLTEFTADVSALIESLGISTAHIVGHDLGGAVAWLFASRESKRCASLSVLSMPHPRALLRALWSSTQLLHSVYLPVMLLPRIPEVILGFRHGELAISWLTSLGLDRIHAERYVHRLKTRADRTGAVNWYRGLPFGGVRASLAGRIAVPTLYVWGQDDAVIAARAARATADFIDGTYGFVTLTEGTHWLVEAPDDVFTPILQHLRDSSRN